MAEKSVSDLEKELARAKINEERERQNNIEKNRDFSVVGVDPASTVEKKIPASNDIPDVIILPKKSKGRKENIPY
tara:strand:- start:1267 stop:1491 length:225 start_codon:yes stop_codon:yes gene_type:complete